MSIFRTLCRASFAAVLALASLALLVLPVHANDGIFPPAPVAQNAISFDGRGFFINGQRTFIASGSLHYPRAPRAQWRDILLKMKAAGFNTVQTYAFWNYHEPKEGQFDFTGDKDFGAFLKLVHEVGMYATVRIGPYACAEWDSGGYPVWLRFKPGVKVRQDNSEFLSYVDKWYDKILPIVVANQIHRGGAVIFVQLENEYPGGWGTDDRSSYLRHLRAKALAAGVEVPTFFSGLHHSADPAGNNPWSSAGRTDPWYTTEFWPGWYSDYGPHNPGNLRRFDRGTWKILAYGGSGYNYYMLFGGSNFANWNNDEDAASYDYGAAIGQAEDLRPMYYRFKRAAWFARSFPAVLEDSDDATSSATSPNPALRVTARKAPAGTIAFYDNDGKTPQTLAVKPNVALTVEAGEIVPVVSNYKLARGISLDLGAARLLRVFAEGKTTTLVAYGQAGTAGELDFTGPSGPQTASLTFADEPKVSQLAFGDQAVRVIAVSSSLADRTWFPTVGDQTYVVIGPDYVSGARLDAAKRLAVDAETVKAPAAPSWAVAPNGALTPLHAQPLTTDATAAPSVGAWQTATVTEDAPSFDDSAWLKSADPLPMGADGDYSAYAWYRTKVNVAKAGEYRVAFKAVRDKYRAFVDGKPVPQSDAEKSAFHATFTPGEHTVSVLAASYGRDKLFDYLGPLDTVDAKGLSGGATFEDGASKTVPLSAWSAVVLPHDGIVADTPPTSDNPALSKIKIGDDAFHNSAGKAWYVAQLPDLGTPPAGLDAHLTLRFESVDDHATVYVNGVKLAQHEGWDEPFEVDITAAWHAAQPNTVAVLVGNSDGKGGIVKPVTLALHVAEAALPDWRMRGGVGEPSAIKAWATGIANPNALPAFYRTTFTAAPPPVSGYYPVLRVVPTGLSGGFVWVNGHNLGRYPEKVHVDGLYVPPTWLRAGSNDLTIFDEQGNSPAQAHIEYETAAGRYRVMLTE